MSLKVRKLSSLNLAGYAFIEFEHERDLKNSYKQGDGKKIDGISATTPVDLGVNLDCFFFFFKFCF